MKSGKVRRDAAILHSHPARDKPPKIAHPKRKVALKMPLRAHFGHKSAMCPHKMGMHSRSLAHSTRFCSTGSILSAWCLIPRPDVFTNTPTCASKHTHSSHFGSPRPAGGGISTSSKHMPYMMHAEAFYNHTCEIRTHCTRAQPNSAQHNSNNSTAIGAQP